jgi:DNA-directed RNA polymerase subunit RPC12/RpoP
MYGSQHSLRVHIRYHLETPIKFAIQDTENLLPAHMLNISDGGMYFESQYAVNLHSDVCIWLAKKMPKNYKEIQMFDFYRSKVLWCREINKGVTLGIGVQHVNKSRSALGPEFQCSMCGHKIPLGKVHFINDFVYLCSKCYQEMERYTKNSKNEILRFLEGNVF